MDRITAFVDGSDYGLSVAAQAGWAAGRLGLPVVLVHVIGRREAGGAADLSGALALGARTQLLERLSALDAERAVLARERGRAILDGAAAHMAAVAPEARVETRLRSGDLGAALAEAETTSRFVILGKRGEAAGFDAGHPGSNVERALRAATRPVLVANRQFRVPTRFLFAYDASAAAGRALDRLVAGSVLAGLPCDIVTVGAPVPAMRARLAEAAAALRQAGHEVTEHLVTGEPPEVVAGLMTERGADLLVLGKSGHSRLRHLFVGSTTVALMQAVRTPVVVFP